MASSKDYLQFVLEQLSELQEMEYIVDRCGCPYIVECHYIGNTLI